MSLKIFFELVEIKTKLASLFPFLIGLLFAMYHFNSFSLSHTLIFFASMLLFDMSTTAINNYMDYKKAIEAPDFDYKTSRNVIGMFEIPEKTVKTLIIFMLVLAMLLGVWLVYLTNFLVLIGGIICFIIGIFYTYGPIPLSRMPLGEVFSGVTMGFGILFLIVYVNIDPRFLLSYDIFHGLLLVRFDIWNVLAVILVALPSVFTIANVMLANNICDLDDDRRNHRFTLVHYTGLKAALHIFLSLNLLSYIAIFVAVFMKVLPLYSLISMVTFPIVWKNTTRFTELQEKSQTFALSIKDLVLVNGTLIVGLFIGVAVNTIQYSH